MKKIFFVIFIFFSINLTAQKPNQIFYKLYLEENMDEWLIEMNKLSDTASYEEVYQKVMAQYGYIGYLMSEKRKKEIRQLLPSAKENVEYLLELNPNSSELFALRAAFIAFDIATHPYKAPVIGIKCIEFIKKSISLDDGHPLGWIMQASMKYYSPPLFGGSKEEGIEIYHKAVKLFKEKNIAEGNWLYLNGITAIGNWYFEQEQFENCKLEFEKALEIEPEFKWVKDELIPKVEKAIQDQHSTSNPS